MNLVEDAWMRAAVEVRLQHLVPLRNRHRFAQKIYTKRLVLFAMDTLQEI